MKSWYREITEKYDGHLNTGIFGTQFFFETLAAHGLNDVAYEAMDKRDFPSFGRWLEEGGTTVFWEQFKGTGSRNHPMFGGGLNWFYRVLAGVNADENEPGYRHIIVRPDLPIKMDYVRYSNQTPYGKVSSEVKRRSDNSLEMNITIPVGSHATVYIPVTGNSVVKESRIAIETASGVEVSCIKDGRLVVKVKQGRYHFQIEN